MNDARAQIEEYPAPPGGNHSTYHEWITDTGKDAARTRRGQLFVDYLETLSFPESNNSLKDITYGKEVTYEENQ